jgi:methionyl aminopeptidase
VSGDGRIIEKTPREIEKIRAAGRVVARVLARMREAVAPGVTTRDLDEAARQIIAAAGGTPTFLGYAPHGRPPYPGAICASVNEELVHGIPRRSRKLLEGDIVSVDVGCTLDGWVGDGAWTFGVGRISNEAARLLAVTEECLAAAVVACRPDGRLYDIARAVQGHAEKNGLNVIRDYVGHGVGQSMHEGPNVPNYVPSPLEVGAPRDVKLSAGMVLALEPMVCEGNYKTRELGDRWTVVMRDGKLCAHFEHTVAVTAAGPQVLTVL